MINSSALKYLSPILPDDKQLFKDFEALKLEEKILTVALTILYSLAMLFVGRITGMGVFSAMEQHLLSRKFRKNPDDKRQRQEQEPLQAVASNMLTPPRESRTSLLWNDSFPHEPVISTHYFQIIPEAPLSPWEDCTYPFIYRPSSPIPIPGAATIPNYDKRTIIIDYKPKLNSDDEESEGLIFPMSETDSEDSFSEEYYVRGERYYESLYDARLTSFDSFWQQ